MTGYIFIPLNLSALPMTLTDDSAMAAAGDSSAFRSLS
ncbi:hypothetical protein X971_5164 (plasmid) [Agrobacterium tumefaciens LBA4213 (Ach5)]|nr:hypothetical protein X971_5164 [Agrobacterium tumefaciens LBA4213 (Ach5)]